MASDAMTSRSLQDSLTQLAQSFQAHEGTTSIGQLAECLEQLPTDDRSALDRLFSLIYQYTTLANFDGRPTSSTAPRPDQQVNGQRSQPQHEFVSAWPEAGRSPTSRSLLSAKRRRSNANASVGTDNASTGILSARVQNDLPIILPDNQAPSSPLSLFLAEADPSGLACQSVPGVRPDSAVAIPGLVNCTQLSGSDAAALQHANAHGTLKFSAKTEALLQTCMQDPTAFLRAVEDGKVSLPNGQGWEAAIATKRNNADLRELTRIFHRFECYNIYKHVVDAGYHTGCHWIRDMRPSLADKLTQDFPESFIDQKAANKCLNWVDQGCRYREWAEKLSDHGIELGCLIALPCDVPHSTYTSRCTKEHMSNTIIELKKLGIQKVVDRMKLSVLADHIIKSLHEMTTRRPDISTARVDCVPPSIVRSPHDPTRREPVIFDADRYVFDAFADSWLEDTWFMDEMSNSAAQSLISLNAPATIIPSCTDFSLSPLSNRLGGSPTALNDVFSESFQQQLHSDRFPVDNT